MLQILVCDFIDVVTSPVVLNRLGSFVTIDYCVDLQRLSLIDWSTGSSTEELISYDVEVESPPEDCFYSISVFGVYTGRPVEHTMLTGRSDRVVKNACAKMACLYN